MAFKMRKTPYPMNSPMKGARGADGAGHDPDNHLFHHPESVDSEWWKDEKNLKHLEDHSGTQFNPRDVKSSAKEADHDHHPHNKEEYDKINEFIRNRFKQDKKASIDPKKNREEFAKASGGGGEIQQPDIGI